MNERIQELGSLVREGIITWDKVTQTINSEFDENLSKNAIRQRYKRNKQKDVLKQGEETYFENGNVEVSRKIFFDPNEDKTPEVIMKKLGYNIDSFDLVEWRFGSWEVAIRGEDVNRLCTTIRAKLKPKVIQVSMEEKIQAIKSVIKKEIKPLEIQSRPDNKELDNNKMSMLGGIESHLNKLCFPELTESYNIEIAKENFRDIVRDFIEKQKYLKAGICYLPIGNDLFNSDTPDNKTTRGTQMTNVTHWKIAFRVGVELYLEAIETIREHFNRVELSNQGGNHDLSTSFMMYETLRYRYLNDERLNFSTNINPTQALLFGNNLIITNHGDKNIKRFIDTIPARFRELWGQAKYVYVFTGHEHHDEVRNNKNGLTHQKLSTHCPIDEWHDAHHYVDALRQQTFVVFDKEYGKCAEFFMTFDSKKEEKENDKPKVLIKK